VARKEIRMFADALPPPTYFSDWHMIGWPASWIVPLSLSMSLAALFLVVARRARRRWIVLTLASCVVLFVVADYVAYEIGCHHQDLWRTWQERPGPPGDLERTTE
jgi:hypothetical protein